MGVEDIAVTLHILLFVLLNIVGVSILAVPYLKITPSADGLT